MAMFDSATFNPQSFGGGMSNWLQDALRTGLLGRSAMAQQEPMEPQTGPTFANGQYGAMGGVPFQIMGQPNQAALPPAAQPVQYQQPQSLPPLPQQNILSSIFDAVSLNGPTSRRGEAAAQRQQQEATYQALLKAGAPPQIAQAAAMNPTVLTQAGPHYLGDQNKVVPFGASLVNQRGEPVFQGNTGDMLLDQPTLAAMAKQYRAGDTTVMQNLGRGAQGAQNIVKLRAEIARQNSAEGISGEEQAIKNAEFFGQKAGQRTLGTRQANIELAATEFKKVVPIVMSASEAVDRTNYPDFNKLLQAYQRGTGDPNIVRLGSGVNTLINLYSRAISPTGVPTVSDKDHAREVLSQAWSKGQFNAAVSIMQQEIDAALQSPDTVKSDMRRRFLGGPPQQEQAAPQPAQKSAPNGVDPKIWQHMTPEEKALWK